MYSRIFFTFVLLASTLFTLPCFAKDSSIGSVNTVKGSAVIVRDGDEFQARLGDSLMAQDMLKTSKDSAMGIVLRDNTTVSLGASSTLAMKEFQFNPSKGLFSIVINMVKGTFVYISGKMGELYPEAIKVETPVGVVAVRGTKFMAKIE